MLRESHVPTAKEYLQHAQHTFTHWFYRVLLPLPSNTRWPRPVGRILLRALCGCAALSVLGVIMRWLTGASSAPEPVVLPAVYEMAPQATASPAVVSATSVDVDAEPSIAQRYGLTDLRSDAARACDAVREQAPGGACGMLHLATHGVCLFDPVQGPFYLRLPFITRQSDPLVISETDPRCTHPASRVVRRYRTVAVLYKTWEDRTESVTLRDAWCLQQLVEELKPYLEHGLDAFSPTNSARLARCPWSTK